MDFIGPLEQTASGCEFIFNYIDYMSRFAVPFTTKTANVEDVLWCLQLAFNMYRKPQAIYYKSGQHFDNEELREFLRNKGVAIKYSPSGASKSTGMVEASNRVLEEVLRKHNGKDWDVHLGKSANAANSRMIRYLGFAPSDILFAPMTKPTASISKLLSLPGRDIEQWAYVLDKSDTHAGEVRKYVQYISEVHDKVNEASKIQKMEMAARYNRGVKQTRHNYGDLVMLWQKDTGKLKPRWKGPFRIRGYGGSHETSFTLEQVDGTRIQGSFYGDHLKQFLLRTGYLADPAGDEILLQKQNIRRSKKSKRPKKEEVKKKGAKGARSTQ